ncbi:MAG: C40 family peptidase [Deltaproteobacteria bacterium]|jgi:cell wall-associated NlpC family hydrolase|nr:C40 family peptidase [Deltaproteobacteria bacterium]
MKKLAICLALWALFAINGCGAPKVPSGVGMDVAKTAHSYLGVPYVPGGRSPKGFDCSGLVWYVYQQYGIKLPTSSSKQAGVGEKVDKDELVPGDLVFFQTKGRIHHVGLYVGAGKMIHAPGRGKKVIKVSINDKYFKQHYALSRRVSQN